MLIDPVNMPDSSTVPLSLSTLLELQKNSSTLSQFTCNLLPLRDANHMKVFEDMKKIKIFSCKCGQE